ncbi:MAG: LacI family transcriptional regulator [Spirochaetae bacterium HGW-Spirochaetae-3]|jgi:alanine racemase|nr:MAG: LacI family transcriptional regulator [Spirochaetae bacterium HGW-Spirochaetae-3]
MRITIKDIALKAGVSKTTVSFAFNNPSKLSAATRERVLRIAEELGYVPDPIARTLTTKRIGAIGLLLPQPIHEALRNPYLGELTQGIGAACLERESALMIVPPIGGRVMEAARRAVVDAMLAIGVGQDHDVVTLIRNRNIPLVTIDGDSEAGFPNVGIDDEAAAFELMSHVLGLGHRRIAVIELESAPCFPSNGRDVPARGSIVCRRRMAGFGRAMAAFGLDPSRTGLAAYRSAGSLDGGRAAASRILDDGSATAVIAMADIVAMGLYQVCADRGVSIPSDLSIASFDDIEFASLLSPGLTSIRQPGYMKGYVAARALLSMLKGASTEGASLLRFQDGALSGDASAMPYELVVRGSTATPRSGA